MNVSDWFTWSAKVEVRTLSAFTKSIGSKGQGFWIPKDEGIVGVILLYV